MPPEGYGTNPGEHAKEVGEALYTDRMFAWRVFSTVDNGHTISIGPFNGQNKKYNLERDESTGQVWLESAKCLKEPHFDAFNSPVPPAKGRNSNRHIQAKPIKMLEPKQDSDFYRYLTADAITEPLEHFMDIVDGYQLSYSPAPVAGCTCGYWAAYEINSLYEAVGYSTNLDRNLIMGGARRNQHLILALVEVRGRIVLSDLGLRAESIRVHGLVNPTRYYNARTGRVAIEDDFARNVRLREARLFTDGDIKRLTKKFGIDVVVSEYDDYALQRWALTDWHDLAGLPKKSNESLDNPFDSL